MSKWISIKDRVPDEGLNVLILYKIRRKCYVEEKYPHGICVGKRSILKNGKVKWRGEKMFGLSIMSDEGSKGFYKVTHWMPIAELPSEYV